MGGHARGPSTRSRYICDSAHGLSAYIPVSRGFRDRGYGRGAESAGAKLQESSCDCQVEILKSQLPFELTA